MLCFKGDNAQGLSTNELQSWETHNREGLATLEFSMTKDKR
jgi:hypothetical protein